jgi:monoamine oxidase
VSRYDCDIAVIGAGLAGLHAASLLEAEGYKVRVLEAKDRVGGRIQSMRQLGANVEAGGTYIGAGYSRVMKLAEQFQLPMIDVTPILKFFREQALVLGDEIIRQADWPAHAANPFSGADRELLPWSFHRALTMRQNPLERPEDWLDPKHAALDISMHEWMQSVGLDEEAIRYGYGINTSFGADAKDVSALLMLFRGAFSKDQRRQTSGDALGFTIKDGVDRLPTAMAEALSCGVDLNMPVESIAVDGDGVQLGLVGGKTLAAERVVCAVPFSVLRDIPITPAFAPPQAEAVATLGSQAITQFYIGVKSSFWEQDGYPPSMFTDSVAGMVAAVRSGADPNIVTHLTAWAMGPNAEALDASGEAEAARRVIRAVERIRPAAEGQLELIASHSWGGDPFARGAWAYFKPGQVRRFAGQMGQSHGRIHFCGEHLARASRGMEAALETAETAIREIMAADS